MIVGGELFDKHCGCPRECEDNGEEERRVQQEVLGLAIGDTGQCGWLAYEDVQWCSSNVMWSECMLTLGAASP